MDTDSIFACDPQAEVGTNEMTQEDWLHFMEEMETLDLWDDGKTPEQRAAEAGVALPF